MQCNDVALSGILYAVKNILNMIMIIAPILAMVCFAILFTKSVVNPDEKKNLSRIRNTGVSLMVIFFIPLFINILMAILGENTNFSSCWVNAQKNNSSSNYIETDDRDKQTFIINPSDYEKGTPKQMKFTYKGNGAVKSQFSEETMRIVEKHLYDFDYSTFNSYMNSVGGPGNYIKSLGGVFTEYYGKTANVHTVYEFQRVSEYVFGLMYMYGFDYYNGSKYCKWGGSCGGNTSSDDAFYPGNIKHTSDGQSHHDFDRVVTGVNEVNMTTHCNLTVDMVYNKAGIWSGERGYSYKSMCSNGRVVHNVADYKVGDVVHFFRKEVDYNNPSTWGEWYHVAYVGEVYDDHVVLYDGGSRFTNNRNFKWSIKKTDNSRKRMACHVVDLK